MIFLSRRGLCLVGVAAMALNCAAAEAQAKSYRIISQNLAHALKDFGQQSGQSVAFTEDAVQGMISLGIEGTYDDADALRALIGKAHLTFKRVSGGYVILPARPAQIMPIAYAQAPSGNMPLEAAAVPATDPSTASAPEIQDIVVTAQRREEKLQNVPISVTALSSQQLSAAGIANVQDVAVLTPSLAASGQLGNFQPRIRGIGSSLFGPGIESSIATYIDGVYVAALPASLFSFAGVDRVEILKGPQGTLFGRNATGGLVQIVTKKPSFTPSGLVNVSYGNYQTISGDIYLTTPASDKIAVDFAMHGLSQDKGYGKNEFTGEDNNRTDYDIAVRSQLLFDSGQGTSVRLAGDYFATSGSQGAFRPYPIKYGTQLFGPQPTSSRPWDADVNVGQHISLRGYGLSGRVDQELPFADLISITAYRDAKQSVLFDLDQTRTDALSIFYEERDRQFSQEVQLASKAGSDISWLVGGYYFWAKSQFDPEEIRLGSLLIDPTFPVGKLSITSTQSTRSYAAFGQATVPVRDVVNITMGLRYTSERRGYEGSQSAILTDGTNVGVIAFQAPSHVTFNKLTWRLALDHRFTPEVMAYVSYNRGFKSGGYNPIGSFNDPPYEPETLDAYEVGVKADLFDRRVRLNPAFFYYDYKNIQVPIYGAGVSKVVNGPSATIYGLDVDFVALITRALSLRGGVSIIHDRFGNFPGAISSVPLPGGGNLLSPINAKGYRLPHTADWSATIAADYEIPTTFGKIAFNVTYNHNDGYFTEIDNVRRQSAYDLISASARVALEGDKVSLTIWGRNLANEAIALIMNSSDNGGGAAYESPRTYGATLGFKF